MRDTRLRSVQIREEVVDSWKKLTVRYYGRPMYNLHNSNNDQIQMSVAIRLTTHLAIRLRHLEGRVTILATPLLPHSDGKRQ